MKLNHGLHLAYCTNIHRGETWADTFAALQTYTLAVRDRVCPRAPYGIGLRRRQVADAVKICGARAQFLMHLALVVQVMGRESLAL